MLVLKVLFCVLVLSGSEKGVAFAKRCFGCVPITSCETGLKFATMVHKGLLPPTSLQTLKNAMCGSDVNGTPKVCCSHFPAVLPTSEPAVATVRTPATHEPTIPTVHSRNLFAGPIETHRNIGLLPSECGDIDGSRVVGGKYTKLYEFPWMTLIAYDTPFGLDYKCGGSIINSRYILTAAHCVIDRRTGQYKNIVEVRIGEWDISTEVDCQGDYQNRVCETKLQDIEVEQIIPHEDFTGQQPVDNDIALLRLKTPIKMENNAAPICLPIYSDLRSMRLAGKSGTVAGWGATENSTSSTKLMKVDLPIKSGDTCNYYYNRLDTTIGNVLCAGAVTKDSCDGDSGGPLMIETSFNGSIRFVQFGVISFGPKKCGSEFPGVYTDVTKYIDWILDNIRE